MENTIQPILCCVGAEVAGEPTQFLMERAAAADHLDWRVITVEVSSDELVRAWQGMCVMRFRAVRFFRSHHSAAMELVGTPSPVSRFVGGITSALRVGDAWHTWHHSGPGLMESLSSACDWSQAVVWLHGDGPQQRGLFAACESRPPRGLVWTAGPPEIPAELASSIAHRLLGVEEATEIHSWLSEKLSVPSQEMTLVQFGASDAQQLETLSACQPTGNCNLIVVKGSPGTRRRLSEQWKAGEVRVISGADMVVAEEAYDQLRWIGRPANLELLKEAYEEYSDF